MKKKNYWPLGIVLLLLAGGIASQLPAIRNHLPSLWQDKNDDGSRKSMAETSTQVDAHKAKTTSNQEDKAIEGVEKDNAGHGSDETVTRQDGLNQKDSDPENMEQSDGSQAQNTPETVQEAQESGAPGFNLMVMDPAGSLIVAGTALGNSEIRLHDGKTPIATTLSEASGDFVFVVDRNFAPGAHELSLDLKREDGSWLQSTQTTLVSVPPREEGGELLATLFENGKVKKVLQRQKIKGKTAIAGDKKEEQELDARRLADMERPIPGQVYIDAVEVDKTEVIVAGKGKPENQVRIYIDQKPLGLESVGKEGAYLVQAPMALAEGLHIIRADMMDKAGKVVARASVALQHGSSRKRAAGFPEDRGSVTSAGVNDTESDKMVAKSGDGEDTLFDSRSANTATLPGLESRQPGENGEVIFDSDGGLAKAGQGIPERRPKIPKTMMILRTGEAMIIRHGDNLWDISRRKYGVGTRYTTIFEANRDQIKDPDLIYPGQVIDVPSPEGRPTPNPAKIRQ